MRERDPALGGAARRSWRRWASASPTSSSRCRPSGSTSPRWATSTPPPRSSAPATATGCGSRPSTAIWSAAFFQRHGVANYLLVDSQGATEGAVKNGTAEAVADITTTGATLRDNHLRVLDDGLILRSQATLYLARDAERDAAASATLARLRERVALRTPAV